MYIKQLELQNFRNYTHQIIKLNPKTNILTGNNGQGKTNILEAINMFSVGRSFRTSKDREMIKIGNSLSFINGNIISGEREYKITIRLGTEIKKAVKINDVPITGLSELLGIFNVVVFSPEDLSLIKGGPKERRSFLDREISQLKPKYYLSLRNYHKMLQQKNNYLKLNKIDNTLLDVYDEQLSKEGAAILKTRQEFLEEISKIAASYHEEISGGTEKISLSYKASCMAQDSNSYMDILRKNRSQDIEKRTSTKGIHRDDIDIKINGIELRDFGSQGQQRSAAISLKLSEIKLIKSQKGEYPVVLLDDIYSELDTTRQKTLTKSIRDTQTIITTAEKINLDQNYSLTVVKNGEIINQEEINESR